MYIYATNKLTFIKLSPKLKWNSNKTCNWRKVSEPVSLARQSCWLLLQFAVCC